MPRYFFDVYNDVVTIDDTGLELADDAAAREQVCRTLPVMLKELRLGGEAFQLRLDVRNEAGERVVAATILMVVQFVAERLGDALSERGKGKTPSAERRSAPA